MSSRNHKEVHGNKRHVANTAGKEQRSKFLNELTKKKRTGEDYPMQPNQRMGDVGGNTQSSMGTPSAANTTSANKKYHISMMHHRIVII